MADLYRTFEKALEEAGLVVVPRKVFVIETNWMEGDWLIERKEHIFPPDEYCLHNENWIVSAKGKRHVVTSLEREEKLLTIETVCGQGGTINNYPPMWKERTDEQLEEFPICQSCERIQHDTEQ